MASTTSTTAVVSAPCRWRKLTSPATLLANHCNGRTTTRAVMKAPAIVVVLLGLLLMHATTSAMAESGGRMGGSSFSSGSSSRSKSWSGSTSRSWSGSTFRSYSCRDCYSYRDYQDGYPFRDGYSWDYHGYPFRDGYSYRNYSGRGDSELSIRGFFWIGAFLFIVFLGYLLIAHEKKSILKLQVGLSGTWRSLQRDLDRIAQTADTSAPARFSSILTETTRSLLRHSDCYISSYSAVDFRYGTEDVEKRFKQLSNEDRGKFDEETLVNVNNVKWQSTSSQRDSGVCSEYIVVTILVAAKGKHTLPVINDVKDLKEALQKLDYIPSSQVLAVEVLWTPQDENDTLSKSKLLKDYPLLRPL